MSSGFCVSSWKQLCCACWPKDSTKSQAVKWCQWIVLMLNFLSVQSAALAFLPFIVLQLVYACPAMKGIYRAGWLDYLVLFWPFWTEALKNREKDAALLIGNNLCKCQIHSCIWHVQICVCDLKQKWLLGLFVFLVRLYPYALDR